MDPRTFQRSLQGDLDALRAVEAYLKATARALLEHPTLGISDPMTRRVLTNAAVAEVLERAMGDADTALAATIMAAARRAVEQERRTAPQDSAAGHLPPGILVSAALVPQVLATASREAAERHVSSCAVCAETSRRVREAAAAVVGQAEGAPAAGAAQTPRSPVGDDEEPSAADVEESSSLDVEGLMARLASHPRPAAEASERKRLRRILDPRRRPGEVEPPLRAAPLVLLALALVGLVLWAGRGWWERPSIQRLDPGIAALAARDVPPLPAAHTLPEALRPGIQDLAAGDCAMAAHRFHLARLRDPGLAVAWYWEGIAGVCAGGGPTALDALRGARDRDPALADLDWYLAQAALLAGEVDPAADALGRVCSGVGRRARQACGIYERLMAR